MGSMIRDLVFKIQETIGGIDLSLSELHEKAGGILFPVFSVLRNHRALMVDRIQI